MGLISRFGNWLDYFMAPKATVEVVLYKFSEVERLSEAYVKRIDELEILTHEFSKVKDKYESDILRLRDELTAIKAILHMGNMKQPSPVRPPTQKFDGSEAWKR